MEKIEKHVITNQACMAGAILGVIVIVFSLISTLMLKAEVSAIVSTFVSVILWIAKFVGCILIMRYFMKKLCREWDDVHNSDTFKLGILSGLFSALLIGIFTYINSAYISADVLAEEMNQTIASLSSILDSNAKQELDKMMEGNTMAVISMISTAIYCFLYGLALSAILSRNIPSRNPFANSDEE